MRRQTAPAASYHPIPRGAIRVALPDVAQAHDHTCGAAALMTVCKYYGLGPNRERDLVRDLDMDPRVGSHSFQLKRAAEQYGLRTAERQPMSLARLKFHLNQRQPVLLMIQAGGDAHRAGVTKNYANEWRDGHWVVAIGYDRSGVFLEDPSMEGVRGYLTYEELLKRWHDVGPRGKRLYQYGLVVWRPRARHPAYSKRARILE